MGRRYTREVMFAATADHARGVQAPVVCRRYGISERTLYRWSRAVARARADDVAGALPARSPDAETMLLRDALAVVLGTLTLPERRRVVDLVRARLQLSREAAAHLLPEGDDAQRLGIRPLRVAVPLSYRSPDAPVAEHFGVAPWLGVLDAGGRFRFVRNVGRSGVAMLAEVYRAGCTDLVVLDIGTRVRDRVDPSLLRVWRADPRVRAREQARGVEQGALEAWPGLLVTLRPPRAARDVT